MNKNERDKRVILPSPLNIGYPIVTDPMGMYSGVPKEPFEIPVQDADDL